MALLANTQAQAESLLHSLKRAAGAIGLDVNAEKTEYMCIYQRVNISTLNGCPLKPSGQVHLPQKQLLINLEWHQRTTSKGMDSYRYAIGHMEVIPDR